MKNLILILLPLLTLLPLAATAQNIWAEPSQTGSGDLIWVKSDSSRVVVTAVDMEGNTSVLWDDLKAYPQYRTTRLQVPPYAETIRVSVARNNRVVTAVYPWVIDYRTPPKPSEPQRVQGSGQR